MKWDIYHKKKSLDSTNDEPFQGSHTQWTKYKLMNNIESLMTWAHIKTSRIKFRTTKNNQFISQLDAQANVIMKNDIWALATARLIHKYEQNQV